MRRLIGYGLLGLVLSYGSQLAAADGPHDKAIKARQAIMQLQNYYAGMLFGMSKGKIEYNAELAQEAADNLSASANLGQSTLWPQGSDSANADNAENRALPAIWETYPAIAEKSDGLVTATAALAKSAGGGLDALKGALGDVGGACKACHDDYRQKKN